MHCLPLFLFFSFLYCSCSQVMHSLRFISLTLFSKLFLVGCCCGRYSSQWDYPKHHLLQRTSLWILDISLCMSNFIFVFNIHTEHSDEVLSADENLLMLSSNPDEVRVPLFTVLHLNIHACMHAYKYILSS